MAITDNALLYTSRLLVGAGGMGADHDAGRSAKVPDRAKQWIGRLTWWVTPPKFAPLTAGIAPA